MTDNLEKEKYIDIYSGMLGQSYQNRHNEKYGIGLWGTGVIDYIKQLNCNSLCDVGCGTGNFCNIISEYIPNVYGVDIASVITNNVIQTVKVQFLDGEAKSIPLENNSVDWITSFDCLEHCLPEDIDIIFNEFYRVSKKGLILSISDLHDSHDGVPLHMTVQPQEWWYEKIKKFGKLTTFGSVPTTFQPYIICEYNKES